MQILKVQACQVTQLDMLEVLPRSFDGIEVWCVGEQFLDAHPAPVVTCQELLYGQALIDGGLVNNIPANVLVSMGCNFVIAVSVTAKLEATFCDINLEKPTLSRKQPGIVPTIFRSLLVQNYNLNAFGVQPADVVIEPDVTGIDASEFMRAKELALIGEAAALERVPKIHRLLNRLDPQLFNPTSETPDSTPA